MCWHGIKGLEENLHTCPNSLFCLNTLQVLVFPNCSFFFVLMCTKKPFNIKDRILSELNISDGFEYFCNFLIIMIFMIIELNFYLLPVM